MRGTVNLGGDLGSLSIWHWVVVIVIFASPILGIVRGVKNGAAVHAIAAAFIPIYGLIYFFAARKSDETARDFRS